MKTNKSIIKCKMCNWKSNFSYWICKNCLDLLDEFHESLKPSRKWFMFLWADIEDQIYIYNKCKWKNRRKQLHIIRNVINKIWYISAHKNSIWKYYKLKL